MARSLPQLVDRMVTRWRLEEARGSLPRLPCVALSRQPGAGADELGHQVAQRLGYEFFGIEIVDLIARERGIQRELVAGLDEHVRHAIERFVLDGLGNRPPPFDERAYGEQLRRTLATLGQRGMAVVLGRGSAHLLPAERALRVFVVAPRAERVERIAKRLQVGGPEAEARLLRQEAERRAFVQRHFHVDPDDPALYDLVVNTSTLGIDGAADLIVRALHTRFPEARRGDT